MREGSARRLARAHVREADEASAAPLRNSDRAGLYSPPGMDMPMTFTGDVPTMRDLMELARSTTRDNIRKLEELRDSDRTPPMVQAAVVGMLLDRGYGKPHQSIAVADLTTPGKLDLSAFSPDELRDFERLLTKATSDQQPTRDITPPKASRGVVPETD